MDSAQPLSSFQFVHDAQTSTKNTPRAIPRHDLQPLFDTPHYSLFVCRLNHSINNTSEIKMLSLLSKNTPPTTHNMDRGVGGRRERWPMWLLLSGVA
mmetsp:Transcript_2357/g.3195  ORF Transcript_2357/g.3195 Transcript_2357/m.3195 type:complete len:97 (+) Transcript_2357:1197-1487(+)